ncbi:NAD-dependent epimerase/dehydratase family protein [uncultured Croceitalea sp.]|uniref:NAD-dependent epimerase/dehydratase family protein n=1 Tax=uncultured Croceitalea sp. TaxID=1798908 RepID=UPI00374FDA1A
MSKTIGIIGCGWLGFPLAEDLLKSGYRVKGTTTSTSKLKTLKLAGIDSYKAELNEDKIEGDIESFLSELHILIVNIPPRLRENKKSSYSAKIKLLLTEIEKTTIKNIVFVSSTSVYGNLEGNVTEDSIPKPETDSGKQLLQCEQLLLQNKTFSTAVIRFGGLIGEDRHPITKLSGKKGLKNGEALVNLIHASDCIHMIKTIVEKEYWNTIFNGVYPQHPTKREYYTNEALKRGLALPEFTVSSTKTFKKIIISKNFLNKSNFLYTPII